MTLTTAIQDMEHSLTIPRHPHLRVGTLGAIVADVAEHFELTSNEVRQMLFGGERQSDHRSGNPSNPPKLTTALYPALTP